MNIDMWKVLAFVFFFTLSGIVWAPVAVYADYSPSGKNWMKNLDDDLLITQITIPGTHDSAADHDHCYESVSCKDNHLMVVCQTSNIQDQMEMGVRFFDVRLAYDQHGGRGFEFHHKPYDLKQSIGDAVGWAEDFLKENPSEFLIWLVKQEHTDEDADAFWRDLSAEFTDRSIEFYSEKKILTVREARGKVIVMARNKSTEYPQGYHVEWPDNTQYYQGSDKDLTYVAEDHYSLNYVHTSTKFVDIRRNLFLARSCLGCGSADTLFITFLSGEGDVAFKYPSHYADYENPHTAKWLTEDAAGGPRSGIIAMDFAGDESHSGGYMLDAAIGQNPPHLVKGWFGSENDGGGITATDVNGDGTPDLIVFMIDAPSGPNRGYYRIGYMDSAGKVTKWTDFEEDVYEWFGTESQGGGITVADVDGNGKSDLFLFFIDNPSGENQGYYRILWDEGSSK